ncbi:uncharacterized protein LOC142219391 [Haematobia irritans]|uniref:uncharacterized protein LOC142219391 n=1 Tax=Haematobia irritans TaxID=7368 RepID=UPI003F505ED8
MLKSIKTVFPLVAAVLIVGQFHNAESTPLPKEAIESLSVSRQTDLHIDGSETKPETITHTTTKAPITSSHNTNIKSTTAANKETSSLPMISKNPEHTKVTETTTDVHMETSSLPMISKHTEDTKLTKTTVDTTEEDDNAKHLRRGTLLERLQEKLNRKSTKEKNKNKGEEEMAPVKGTLLNRNKNKNQAAEGATTPLKTKLTKGTKNPVEEELEV